MWIRFVASIMFWALACCLLDAADANYDEAKVPTYVLPDVLVADDGSRVQDAEGWRKRRAEILRLFEENIYGKVPSQELPPIRYETLEQDDSALDGKATRKQVRIHFADQLHADMLIYVPNHSKKPVPAFMGLNFFGNQTVGHEPQIPVNPGWMRAKEGIGVVNHLATEKTRGVYAHRWQVDMLIDRGYALVTAYAGDFDPDKYRDSFGDGVHALYYKDGQTAPRDDEWGSIGGWAWGLSRMLDYVETDSDIDAGKVAVMGHSRLGKTALWAGASDERFAMVISNDSGCGGAALFRRRFGERIDHMAKTIPDWFCVNYRKYANNEKALPIDQHMLLAMIAPRPLYVASAEQDRWADPKGEFLSAKHASPVYELLGKEGLPAATMPGLDQPVQGRVSYHIRRGPHEVLKFDWQQYLAFADKHLRG